MTAKHWTQPSCPSTGEWLSKWWYIHATEYRSAAKRNKLLLHATSWRNHKGTTLSEKSQSQRLCTTYLVPCTKHSWNNKLQRESLVAARVQGGRRVLSVLRTPWVWARFPFPSWRIPSATPNHFSFGGRVMFCDANCWFWSHRITLPLLGSWWKLMRPSPCLPVKRLQNPGSGNCRQPQQGK